MSVTHRDHEPTSARTRLAAPAVLALMMLLPQLGCAHQCGVARQDGLSRTLRTTDPDRFPGDVAPRVPDRANPAVPMIGADRGPGPRGASGPDGVPLAAPGAMTASTGTQLLAACWKAKIPPPRLRLAPADSDAGRSRWYGDLFAACEAAGIEPPIAPRARGPSAPDELLEACADARILPPIASGMRGPVPDDAVLPADRHSWPGSTRRLTPPSEPPALVETRFRRGFAAWDGP
jgi:hypothetical protein